MQRRTLTILASALALLVVVAVVGAVTGAGLPRYGDPGEREGADDPPTRLSWESLVPPGFVPPEDPYLTMSPEDLKTLFDGSADSERRLAEIDDASRYAPTVPELDGRRVSIPGFVVPLEFDGQRRMEDFLLVPYYGACIHTPPPPANQIVYATSRETVEVESLYEPVWLTGTLRSSPTSTDLGDAGYRMDVTAVEPFAEDDEF